jgi:hypothetical protein
MRRARCRPVVGAGGGPETCTRGQGHRLPRGYDRVGAALPADGARADPEHFVIFWRMTEADRDRAP